MLCSYGRLTRLSSSSLRPDVKLAIACRLLSTAAQQTVYYEARDATLYSFGTPTSDPDAALVRNLTWSLDSSQAWALIGSGAAQLVDASLLGRARAEPRGSVGWPFLRSRNGAAAEVERAIRKVAFRTRLENRHALGDAGGFVDYTARYGGLRAGDEDAVTLRAHLLDHIQREGLEAREADIERVADMLDVCSLLDMPLIVLSNGQTRRARIARALLSKPEVLVLEEPFTGLDVAHRASLADLLGRLHAAADPYIVLTLRPQDEVPDWITHILETSPNREIAYLGPRNGWTSSPSTSSKASIRSSSLRKEGDGEIIARFSNVSIAGRRPVLADVSWQIRAGERWLLKGHNGSGKTTLLSVLLGDHPQSWSLGDSVQLFGKERSKWATSQLQSRIGHASPEINNAFPRRGGLSTAEAIGTGFEGVFTYRRLDAAQLSAITELAAALGRDETWLARPFIEQSGGDQALALLMRALVKKTSLLVLDEPMAGMDDATIAKVHGYLDTGLDPTQALVLVTHYETEVPASVDRTLELADGRVVQCLSD